MCNLCSTNICQNKRGFLFNIICQRTILPQAIQMNKHCFGPQVRKHKLCVFLPIPNLLFFFPERSWLMSLMKKTSKETPMTLKRNFLGKGKITEKSIKFWTFKGVNS